MTPLSLQTQPDIQFAVHTSLSASLSQEWEELWKSSRDAHIANSPHWLLAAIEAFPARSVHIIEARGMEGELLSVASFAETRMYGVRVFCPPAMEFADRMSILGDTENDALMQGLLKEIRKLGTALLSSLYPKEREGVAGNAQCAALFVSDRNWHIDVSAQGIFGDLAKEKKRQLEKKTECLPGEVSFRLTDGNDGEMLERAFALDVSSVKHGRGKSVFWREDARKFFTLLARRAPEHFFVGMLFSGRTPAAYTLGFVKDGVYSHSQKAYAGKFARCRPGGIILLEFLKAVEQEHPKEINLGRGSDGIKSDFTKTTRILYDGIVSENRLIGRYLFAIHRIRERAYSFLVARPRLYFLYKRMRGYPGTSLKDKKP